MNTHRAALDELDVPLDAVAAHVLLNRAAAVAGLLGAARRLGGDPAARRDALEAAERQAHLLTESLERLARGERV